MKDILTYQEIREVHAKEDKTSSLQKLDEDFFKRVNMYLKQKYQMLSKIEEKKDNVFSQASKRKIEKEISNVLNVFKNIIQLREKKIAMRALLDARLGTESTTNMTPLEVKLYKSLLSLFKDFEKEFEAKSKSDLVKVRFLKDTPKFKWRGKVYGPYEKGKEYELSIALADMLIKGKKAEKV